MSAAFARYKSDPVAFASEVLGLTLWSHQKLALEAIRDNRRICWRAAHGVGKTQTVAVAIAWFVTTHEHAVVIVTAPSYRQVRGVVWRTLDSVRRCALVPLGGDFSEVPEHGWKFLDGRWVVGFSATDPDRFAGFHSPNLLAIVDEAAGVDTAIFEVLKGSLTGSSRLFMVGNPVRTSGEFYKAFQSESTLWHKLHTSGYDSPNLTGLESAIPGLVDLQWVDDMADDYGEESAVFAVRVRGEFPLQASDAVITLALVEEAKARWHELMRDGTKGFQLLGRLELGVDPARFGEDEFAIVVRRGPVMLMPITFRGADAVSGAQRVLNVVAEHKLKEERAVVRVDTTGYGGGVADILRKHRHLDVIDVTAGSTPSSDTYQLTRDELWFTMRDWLVTGGALPPDSKLEGELLAPTYSFTPRQKISVEKKDDTKKRLRRSPDRADAASLAVYSLNQSWHLFVKAMNRVATAPEYRNIQRWGTQ